MSPAYTITCRICGKQFASSSSFPACNDCRSDARATGREILRQYEQEHGPKIRRPVSNFGFLKNP